MNAFHARDLFVLVALLLAQPFHPLFALAQVAGVVPGDSVGQPAQPDLGDARHDRVEEDSGRARRGRRRTGSLGGTPPASCGPRGRDGSSARRAAAGSAGRAGAWRARCASASRRRTSRVGCPRSSGAKPRPREYRRRSSGRCCSRRAGGSGPAGRCSARASTRARSRARRGGRAAPPAPAISARMSSSGSKARPASSKTVRPECVRPSCGR